MRNEWRGFAEGQWTSEVDLRDFIQKNYTPYNGAEDFLAGPTEATDKLWGMLKELQKQERAKDGVLDMETKVVSSLTAYPPSYIGEGTKELEKVVGLQTDKPLKRAFMPYGGIKMAEQACTTYGYQPSQQLHDIFTKYVKTHNDGVFDAYTTEMRRVRHNHILTGLPDSYGRGRIVGDYRRVALYGIDFLVAEKQADLENMGPSPEPNLTVLYSSRLPQGFKHYAAKISVVTSSIQYENDDVMRPVWGDDYSICCCVSATQTGKEMQFFGARANLAKCLLYAINGGVDTKSREQCGPAYRPITSDVITYEEFMPRFEDMMEWLAGVYVKTLNLIHYMHDKYFYEAAEMALIDTNVRRTFATGIAGFSHVVDSICAIKYAKVTAVRDEEGFAIEYKTEGDYPRYGNDDERADEIAVWLLKTFMKKIRKFHTYRNSEATTSILTITSNVVYGKYTGAMPDGRAAGTPLAPGANPSYGAEKNGLLASLNSVAKLPYEYALDGISNTQTINPGALGQNDEERSNTLVGVMDGYFDRGAHHLNVNVFGVDKLRDAMEHPEKEEYANFTIRVSGYAVKFIDLTREQQLDVIARHAHENL